MIFHYILLHYICIHNCRISTEQKKHVMSGMLFMLRL